MVIIWREVRRDTPLFPVRPLIRLLMERTLYSLGRIQHVPDGNLVSETTDCGDIADSIHCGKVFYFIYHFFELFEYVTENFINQSEYPRLQYVIFHIPYSHGNKIEQNLNEIEKSTEFVINKKNIRSSLNVDCNILNVEI